MEEESNCDVVEMSSTNNELQSKGKKKKKRTSNSSEKKENIQNSSIYQFITKKSSIMRIEPFAETKLNVCETPINVIEMARGIAKAKSLKDIDDAFMVINLDMIQERLFLWQKELPDILPYYAVKCNSDVVVLRTLAALGVNFDCASREEIDTILSLGVSTDRIIYANPCKTRSFIKHSEEVGVHLMTFDNVEELEKIVKLHYAPQLILRIAVSDPTATCPLNLKFGAEPTTAAAELLGAASRLGVAVRGISFHVGSGCNDPTAYQIALQHSRNLTVLGKSLGLAMDMVDIGGGFPGSEDHALSFEQIASVVRTTAERLFPVGCGVRLIAEPGRFFAASPCTLVTNIFSATQVAAEKITKNPSDAEGTGFMYYMNDGVYGSFNCILFDHVNPVGRPLFDSENVEMFPSTVWGPTCDSLDMIEDKKMMRRLNVGDWLVYENMGAYTCAASTTFNGFQRPTPIYVLTQKFWERLGF